MKFKKKKRARALREKEEASVAVASEESGDAPLTDTGEATAENESETPPDRVQEEEAPSPLDRLSPGERAALIAALGTRIREEAARAEAETIAELDSLPEYAGIAARADAIRALPARFPFLRELSMRDRLIAAYHIDRSLDPPQPSMEQQLSHLLDDPILLRVLAEKWQSVLAARRESIPPVATRAGTAGAPANKVRAPRNLREAALAARNYLGINKKEKE